MKNERISVRAFQIVIPAVLCLSVISPVCAQPETAANDTVALVNGRPISAADFQKRFDLTIYPHKEDASAIQVEKERFLFSMVAEQLLADEGHNSGALLAQDGSRLEKQATQTFLRDALYRRQIMDSVRISAQDIAAGIKRARQIYTVDVYHFPDTSAAYSFYKECSAMRAARLDSFVARVNVPHDTVRVRFGVLMQAQENTFWGKPKGSFTLPMRGQNQFIVVRVLHIGADSSFAGLSVAEQEAKIGKVVRKRRETALAETFMYRAFGDVQATVDHELVRMLVDSISFVLKQQAPSMFQRYYYLTTGGADGLLRMFAEKDSLPMVSLVHEDDREKDRSMTLGDVIGGLVPATFLCRDTSRNSVFSGLQFTLRHVVENDLLAEYAEESGLQDSDDVHRDVEMTTTAFLAERVRKEITDTVRLTDAELDDFIRKYRASDLRKVELRIQRFRTASLDGAVDVFNNVKNLNRAGAPDVAYVLRGMSPDTLISNAYLLGNVGAFFTRHAPGQIYGPVKLDDGYVLYRLISKSSVTPDTMMSQTADTLRYIALKEKQDRVLNRYVASLAKNGNVKIFLEALKRVIVTPVQMFTVRNIGFGGQINAVPGLPVCEDWVRVAPMKQIMIP